MFKYVSMYQRGHAEDYAVIRRIVSLFGTATIFLSIATMCVAIKCMANFNKGLKPHITPSRVVQGLFEDHEMEMEMEMAHSTYVRSD